MPMRETVKVRSVAGSLVVSLPQSVLEPVGLKEGDRVIVEAAPPRRLVITKEGKTMTSTQHLEMEIDLLEKKKKATESDLRYKARQYNGNMPCEEGMSDNDVAFLILMSIERDRDLLDVEIAEKRLELYTIQAGEVSEPATVPEEPHAPVAQPTELENQTTRNKTERAWYYLAQENGRGQFLALANAKGSCSLRRFEAQDGTAIPKGRNRSGHYRDSFSPEIEHAILLNVTRQPNLERDCKERLPLRTLQELQGQAGLATANV
jgi:antitoxin component of MazEF toxin-antitoxin module